MHETFRRIFGRGAAVAGLALTLGGCAYSLGDFGLERPQQPEMSAAALPPQPAPQPLQSAAQTTVPLQATALADEPVTTGSIGGPSRTGTFVTPGVPQDQPQSKLLSPEEKARVVAELEALAKGQKVGVPVAAPAAANCADETLDPAERLRREKEGIQC